MMKAFGYAGIFTALAATAALSAELPIRGFYCGEGIEVSSSGVGFEDWACVADDVSSAPKFAVKCSGDGPDTLKVNVTLRENLDRTLTYSDDDGQTFTLRACS